METRSDGQRPTKVIVASGAASPRREREVTLPGRAEASQPELPASPAELRITRLLLATSVGAAIAFAFASAVAFQLILYSLRGGQPLAAEPVCVEGNIPEGCPDGEFCQAGQCQPIPPVGRCDVGDPCGAKGTCECAAPMTCEADTCTLAEPPPQATCDNPVVQAALKQLEADCAGDIRSCPGNNLQKFAIKYDQFDWLMAQFPRTVSVHFPGKQPPIDAKEPEWPTGPVRDYYLERLRASAPALKAAKYIFIISRSSPGGNPRRNELYAQARGKKVKDLLVAALDLPTAERDQLEGKFRDFVLGNKLHLEPEFFADRYANRFITWSASSRDRLVALLAAKDIAEADRAWADQMINQVVLVVPVDCELK